MTVENYGLSDESLLRKYFCADTLLEFFMKISWLCQVENYLNEDLCFKTFKWLYKFRFLRENELTNKKNWYDYLMMK